jgi:hypothetical protein
VTPERLLQEAFGSSSPDERGLQKLRARIDAAAKALTDAQTGVSQCEAHESRLFEQQSAVNARLAALRREADAARRTDARAVLDAISDPKRKKEVTSVLADAAEKQRANGDQISILRDALDHLVTGLIPAAVIQKTEAQIGVARASLAWVTASAHADLLHSQMLLGPALRHDPSLSVNVVPGSHAHAFSQKINELNLEIAALQERLQRERSTFERKAS